MSQEKKRHYVSKIFFGDGKTICGADYSNVDWTQRKNDVTCLKCIEALKKKDINTKPEWQPKNGEPVLAWNNSEEKDSADYAIYVGLNKNQHVASVGNILFEYDKVAEHKEPQFKRGDVVINYSNKSAIVIRVDSYNKKYLKSLSYLHYSECIEFNQTHESYLFSLSEPTQDHIDKLERHEKLNGKKWNQSLNEGKGDYEAFLTADGLTVNELLKHDFSEIELHDSKNDTWRQACSKELIKEGVLKFDYIISFYRLKPQPKFRDYTFNDDIMGVVFYNKYKKEKIQVSMQVELGIVNKFSVITYSNLLENYTLKDGSPAGVEIKL